MAAKKAPKKKTAVKKATSGNPQIVAWGDPPPSKKTSVQRGTKYQDIIDTLIANPGKPALVMEDANTASAEPIRKTPGIRLFTRQLGNGNTRVNIWAVYDPDGKYKAPSGQKEVKKAPAKKPVAKKAAAKKVAAPAAIGKKPRPKASVAR